MSIEALSTVKPRQTGNASRKAVLLVLADYADEKWSCYPSQERLANETELSVRTVRRLLAELEEAGLVRRTMRRDGGGHRTSDRITLVRPAIESLPAKLTAWQESQPATDDALPANDDSQPATDDNPYRSQEPGSQVLEPSGEPSVERKARRCPEGWAPHERHAAKADEYGLDLALEAEQFQNHHRAKGTRFVDWDAGFYTWLTNGKKWKRDARQSKLERNLSAVDNYLTAVGE